MVFETYRCCSRYFSPYHDCAAPNFSLASDSNVPDIVYADRNLRFSYAEFNIRVDYLANALLHLGMRPDDKLGIFANNVYVLIFTLIFPRR